MTLSPTAAIPDALQNHLAAFSIDADQIAWPDSAFTPTDGVAYLEVTHLPNETASYGICDEGPHEYRGFMQVSVMYPGGQRGTIPALDLAGQVIAHFAKGTRLESNGVQVRIERQPWAAPPLVEPDRLRVPVSIPYRVFHQ